MIFDGAFSAAGDDDNVFDARGDRFFDRILNERLVDQRQHLFGRGFGGGKEPGPKAGSGNDRFSDSRDVT